VLNSSGARKGKKMEKLKLKKGDRVWVKVPTNATIKSVNKKYGYTLKCDDGTEFQYFTDDETDKIAPEQEKK
jgi:hypothetical protein